MKQTSNLQPKLREKILHKANVECPETNLNQASMYIKQLRGYLDGSIDLSMKEIESKLGYLVGCMTITLDIPIEGLEFFRARTCHLNDFFSNVELLSYIKTPQANCPAVGRLNKDGKSLFYASVIINNSDIVQAVLSEIKAKEHDRVGVLRSEQISGVGLQLRYIGIWEFFRLHQEPVFMTSEVYSYYQEAYSLMRDEFPPKLFMAYSLTDHFLSDIMSMKGSDRLYQITSIVASIMLDSNNIDGILYMSVEAGFPSVAIKPKSVDQKIQHNDVRAIHVTNYYGYSFYEYQVNKTFTIDPTTGVLQ